jgi:N-acyl-D-aspartate/D-glutamate deacylase
MSEPKVEELDGHGDSSSITDEERKRARVLNARVEKLAKALCEALEANGLTLSVSYTLADEDGSSRELVCFATPAFNKEAWDKHLRSTRAICDRLIQTTEAEEAAAEEEKEAPPKETLQ